MPRNLAETQEGPQFWRQDHSLESRLTVIKHLKIILDLEFEFCQLEGLAFL